MSTARILRPGYASSVQDAGRGNHLHEGIGISGVLDTVGLRIANALVGNAWDAAVIETSGGLEFECTDARRVALAGAFEATIDGERFAPWSGTRVAPGQRVRIETSPQCARAVVAVEGGIDVEPVLGSRSTDLLAAFGGHCGRVFRAADELPLGAKGATQASMLRVQPPEFIFDRERIRVLPGPDASASRDALDELCSRSWRIAPQSSRIGCRLGGDALPGDFTASSRSHAVFPGVVQVPPSGLPIVLLADAQTTGGYVRLAVVIEADLWKFAAMQPGQELRFSRVSLQEAAGAKSEIERYVQNVERSVSERLQ